MIGGPVSVLLVGLDEADASELTIDDAFTVRRAPTFAEAGTVEDDAVVVALDGTGPLERLQEARRYAPSAAVVVITDPAREADGAIALHAGAEDHVVRDGMFAMLLPRAVRYAVALRQVRRELATSDEVTALPNLRGFAPIAEHHLRMADRTGQPVIFVFVRLDDHDTLRAADPGGADDLARDAASVVLEAVRDADVPARIAPDTIVVLLAGATEGSESVVLSRLVESMAVHDAARTPPRSLALSVGTARYEPGTSGGLAEYLSSAFRGLAAEVDRWRNESSGEACAADTSGSTYGRMSRSAEFDMPGSLPLGTVDLTDAQDRGMIDAVAGGDEDAFRDLFARYASTAKALAVRVVRQPHMAEEIVQEAFLSVWRNPGGYDPDRGSVRAWLMAMVHHRAVDTVRREESQRRRAADASVGLRDEVSDHADEVVGAVARPQERRAVRAALAGLPSEQRETLERMYYEGQSQSQIAATTGLPLGTVKSRTLLGMRKLKVALEEMER